MRIFISNELKNNDKIFQRILSTIEPLKEGSTKRGHFHKLTGYDNLYSMYLKGKDGKKARLILRKLENGRMIALHVDLEHKYIKDKLQTLDIVEIPDSDIDHDFNEEISIKEGDQVQYFAGGLMYPSKLHDDLESQTFSWCNAEENPTGKPFIAYINSIPGSGKTSAALQILAKKISNSNHGDSFLYLSPTKRLCDESKAALISELGEEIVDARVQFMTYQEHFQLLSKKEDKLDSYDNFKAHTLFKKLSSKRDLYHDCIMAISAGSLEGFKKLGDRNRKIKDDQISAETIYNLAKKYQDRTSDPNFKPYEITTNNSPTIVVCDEAQTLSPIAATGMIIRNLPQKVIDTLCQKFAKKTKEQLINDVPVFALHEAVMNLGLTNPPYTIFCGDSRQNTSGSFSLMNLFRIKPLNKKNDHDNIYSSYRCSEAVAKLCQNILDKESSIYNRRKVSFVAGNKYSAEGFVGKVDDVPNVPNVRTAIIVIDPERKEQYRDHMNVFTAKEAIGLEFDEVYVDVDVDVDAYVYVDVNLDKVPNTEIITSLFVAASRARNKVHFINTPSNNEDPINQIISQSITTSHKEVTQEETDQNENDPESILSYIETLIKDNLIKQASQAFIKLSQALQDPEYAERVTAIRNALNESNQVQEQKPMASNPHSEFEKALKDNHLETARALLASLKAPQESNMDTLQTRCNILLSQKELVLYALLDNISISDIKLFVQHDPRKFHKFLQLAIKKNNSLLSQNLFMSTFSFSTEEQISIINEIQTSSKTNNDAETKIRELMKYRVLFLEKASSKRKNIPSNKAEEFLRDCQNGSIDKIVNYFKDGYDIHALITPREEKINPLYEVVSNNNVELLKIFIMLGNNINLIDNKNNTTTLYIAAGKGHHKCVRTLLEFGANPDTASEDGYTALHTAASKGHHECVRTLLEFGANPDTANKDGFTALHFAAGEGHHECVKALLEFLANPDTVSKDGITALHTAASKGHHKCVRTLLEFGIYHDTVSKDGYTALHMAAGKVHHECVKALLEFRANPDTVSKDGITALYLAACEGHHECVKALLEFGANPDTANKDGITALHMAAGEGHHECVRTLLEFGANPDTANKDGITAFHMAAGEGHHECVRTLLEYLNHRNPPVVEAAAAAVDQNQPTTPPATPETPIAAALKAATMTPAERGLAGRMGNMLMLLSIFAVVVASIGIPRFLQGQPLNGNNQPNTDEGNHVGRLSENQPRDHGRS